MPSRKGLRENPKATARKEAQQSVPLRKQKRKPIQSNDSVDRNSTDSKVIVLQPKKKRLKVLQRESEGGDVSNREVDIATTSGPEIEEVMIMRLCEKRGHRQDKLTHLYR